MTACKRSPGARWILLACWMALAMSACGGGGVPAPGDAAEPDGSTGVEIGSDAVTDNAIDTAIEPEGSTGVEAEADTGPEAAMEIETEAAPETGADPSRVRFVHLSDLHVTGEGQDAGATHVHKAFEKLSAVDFAADFVAATGDFVDYLPPDVSPQAPSAYDAALAELDGLPWPFEVGIGNHEFYLSDSLLQTDDRQARAAYVSGVAGVELDRAWDVRGVRFVMLNSMGGDLWKSTAGLAGSFSDEQLTFLRAQLDAGLPTVLFLHHPPTTEYSTPGGDSLCAAINDHPGTVLAIFAGHLHGFWKGTACGVPYYLSANVDPYSVFYYLVEVDPAARSLTIVNQADITFTSFPELDCDPDGEVLSNPALAVGSFQVVATGMMVSNLPGLDSFNGSGLDKVPPVLAIDGWDPVSQQWQARLTTGRLANGFVAYSDQSPCAPITLNRDGACLTSSQAAFELNLLPLLGPMLGVSVNPAWKARLEITSLWLEGRLTDDGGAPYLPEGLIHITGDGRQAVTDLQGILVSEYCEGRIASCVPGAGSMPACPDPFDAAFFPQVPKACDVAVGSYKLRLLLTLLGSYPLENVNVVGHMSTRLAAPSATPLSGAVDSSLFSTEPGMNCE